MTFAAKDWLREQWRIYLPKAGLAWTLMLLLTACGARAPVFIEVVQPKSLRALA